MTSRKLSILDFGYFMPPEIQAANTLNFTFDFIREIEDLGYHRYWMAEHYYDYCCWTNPEILLAVLAGCTERLKVGVAGVAIFYHNPYKVASAFKMLSAIYADRIDLGIARGRAPEHMVGILTGRKKITKKVFTQNIEKLLAYFSTEFLYADQENYIPLPPYGTSLPQCWLLGTSSSSAAYANQLNVNFSLSLFHSKNPLSFYTEIIKVYKDDHYKKFGKLPEFNVAIQCSCIDNPQRLKKFATASKIDYKNPDNLYFAGNANYCIDHISRLYETLDTSEIVVYDHNRNLEERLEAVNLIGKGILSEKMVYGQ